MSETLGSVRAKVDLILGDSKNTLYGEDQKNAQINESLQDIVAETKCHVRRKTIQMRDRKTTYEFPIDMLQPVNITLFQIRGSLIFNTVYQTMVSTGTDFNVNDGLAASWNAPGTRSGSGNLNRSNNYAQFREIVSDHEFILDPVFDAEVINPNNPQVVAFGE